MIARLMKATGILLLTSLLASAIVFTGLHQMFWRFQPVSTLPAEQLVVQVTNAFGTCSGVVVAPTLVLTANHCAGPDMGVNGKNAYISKQDEANDVMILRVPDLDMPIATLATSDPIIGEKMYMIGFPIGLAKLVSIGTFVEVAPLDSAILNSDMLLDYIVNGPVEGGFSGGGVFVFRNGQFELIGIVNAGSRTITLVSSLGQIKHIINE